MRKQWTAQDYRAIKGVKRNEIERIKDIAKTLGRTYASVYVKVWQGGKRKAKVTREAKTNSKVKVTKQYVIVKDYKSISLINGSVRIKL
jgi:hypothetical protein